MQLLLFLKFVASTEYVPERATRSEGRSSPTVLKLSFSCLRLKNGAGRFVLARSINPLKLSLLPLATFHEGPPAYYMFNIK